MNRPNNFIVFLRTTAVGGLLFLLPLIVVAALVGHVVPIVMSIAEFLGEFLPAYFKSPSGYGLLVLLAIAVLFMLCFAAGILARISFSRGLSEAFEKKLLLIFPRYAILKDQMADSIGGDHAKPQMKPVLVRFDDQMRLGFETERADDSQTVAVYLPGSPDPWAGQVVLVSADRVSPLQADFGEAANASEQLGRGSAQILARTPTQLPPGGHN